MNTVDFRSIPKLELHRHLEGALRLSTIRELAQREKLDLPYDNEEAFRAAFQVRPGEERTLVQFLTKFTWLRRLLTDRETLARITFETIEDSVRDGVVYTEIRFNYAQLLLRGFTDEMIMGGLADGLKQAEAMYPIRVGLICGISRELPLEYAEKTVDFAIANQKNGIVAIDLMNDERFLPELFVEPFARAKAAGLHITVHAGEAAGPENIINSIRLLNAERIGHGARILQDPAALRLTAERSVLVECCLSSNLQTGAVPSLEAHPLPVLLRENIPVCLNTDDPGVSDLTLSGEFEVAHRQFGLNEADLRQMQLRAADYIFRDDLKPWLRDIFSKI